MRFHNVISIVDLIRTAKDIYQLDLSSSILIKALTKYEHIVDLILSNPQNFIIDSCFKWFSAAPQRLFNRTVTYPERQLIAFDLAANAIPLRTTKYTPQYPTDLIDADILATRKRLELCISKRFMTVGNYVSLIQFGPSGYYNRGRVKFTKNNMSGHYSTYASSGQGLAVALAERAYEIWQQMLETGEKAPDSAFLMLEIGAGDGDLCVKILQHIKAKAQQDLIWQAFYTTIRYAIIDKADELRNRQRETTKEFADKVNIYKGDALNLAQSEFNANTMADMAFSNELPDMFLMEEIQRNESGQILVGQVIVDIDAFYLNEYLATLTKNEGVYS